ncbi:MAG: hypothetical protein AB2404_11720, partial [Planifilum fimeticola]
SSTKQHYSQSPSRSNPQQQKPKTTQPTKTTPEQIDGGSQTAPPSTNTDSNKSGSSSDKKLLDVDLNLGIIKVGIKL